MTDRLQLRQSPPNPGKSMVAVYAIVIFIAAIFALNMIDFGRPD